MSEMSTQISEMTDYGKSILIGLAIGDGYIGKTKRGNCQFAIDHGPKQGFYCEAKMNIVSSVLGKKINLRRTKRNSVQFTIRHPWFNGIWDILYSGSGGKKKITEEVLSLLNDEVICYWFMDDGCLSKDKRYKNSYKITLSTCCSEEEAKLIQKFFLNKYNIKFSIGKNKKSSLGYQYFLRGNTETARVFASKFSKYCVPGMEYKFIDIRPEPTLAQAS